MTVCKAGLSEERFRPFAGFPEPAIAQGAAQLPRQLAGYGPAPQAILVRPCGAGRWKAAAGLVLELRRRGWPAYVPDTLVPLFGTQRRLPGTAHVEVIVADRSTAPAVGALPASRPVAGSGGRSWGLYYRLSDLGFSGSAAAESASPGSEPELAALCRRT